MGRGRKLTIILLVLVAVIACTGNTSVSTPRGAEPGAKRVLAAQVSPATGLVMTAAPTQIPGFTAAHTAFPGLATRPDGTLELVARVGSDHYLARDGDVVQSISTDHGLTYSAPTVILTGDDYRDPSVSYVGGQRYLTYFTGSAALAAEGAMLRVGTGPEVRIDTLPYAAIAAPIVQLPDGRLGAAFYGRKPGETLDTAFMGWSSDGGATWTTNRIINIGVDTAEPWLVVDGTQIHMFSRWGGWDSIAVRSSPDSGVTWGPVRKVTTNCTGRPSSLVTRAGTIVMICRLLPSLAAKVIYSLNHTSTWVAGPTVMAAPPGPIGMTYAVMVEVLPGVIHMVVGMETTSGSSALYSGWLAEKVG
jgi:hypothetical protein